MASSADFVKNPESDESDLAMFALVTDGTSDIVVFETRVDALLVVIALAYGTESAAVMVLVMLPAAVPGIAFALQLVVADASVIDVEILELATA